MQSYESMRLAVIQYIRCRGRWELQSLTMLEAWMGGDPDVRVVTVESLREDYGISPLLRTESVYYPASPIGVLEPSSGS